MLAPRETMSRLRARPCSDNPLVPASSPSSLLHPLIPDNDNMRIRVGTSGYSYKEWKGTFYPEDLPAAKMLPYYGERFDSVEINNTFYRMPPAAVGAEWGEQVPDGFTFVLKAPQRITHSKKLADASADVKYLFEVAATLGAKQGPILFQLPPFLKKDAARLHEFVAELPEQGRVAFEFRHASW